MKNIAEQINNTLKTLYPAEELQAITRALATELLGIPQSTYYLKTPFPLSTPQQSLLSNAIERLTNHEPLQYILGYSHFRGLRLKVTPATLIPRPETSELTDWIASESRGNESILDIGTGSGCIAIALASMLPHATIEAIDISPEALAIAAENAATNNVHITFEQADILTYTPSNKQYDTIVSNPPYIKELEKATMEPNVLLWEPHTALFVPNDNPLLFYRTIAHKALHMLKPGGRLYFEINSAHSTDTLQLLSTLGYHNIELRNDIFGNPRITKATRP